MVGRLPAPGKADVGGLTRPLDFGGWNNRGVTGGADKACEDSKSVAEVALVAAGTTARARLKRERANYRIVFGGLAIAFGGFGIYLGISGVIRIAPQTLLNGLLWTAAAVPAVVLLASSLALLEGVRHARRRRWHAGNPLLLPSLQAVVMGDVRNALSVVRMIPWALHDIFEAQRHGQEIDAVQHQARKALHTRRIMLYGTLTGLSARRQSGPGQR